MRLELLDAYSIRARLSASIILLAPVVVTIFFCFEEIITLTSSSILIGIILAFTNYIPILQRRACKSADYVKNYAAEFLYADNNVIDAVSKARYYNTLAKIDNSFSAFQKPENTESFQKCCISAVIYLRNHTRDNRLVQEENITYGFCKNLCATKKYGIIFSLACGAFTGIYAWNLFGAFSEIPLQYYFTFVFNIATFAFWIWGVTKPILEDTATRYAKTLLAAIDSL